MRSSSSAFLIAVAATLALIAPAAALAQDEAFPSKSVRLVPCCAGIIDAIARNVGEDMAKSLGQSIVVDTKPGASGMIAAEFVASARADGYTVLIGTNSTHAANQSLFAKVPYDFVKDFVPISGIAQGVIMLVANPQLPAASVAELTSLARAKPGQIKFGWGSSSTRAGGELYRQLTGADILSVPYKTNPQATADVMSGQIDIMWADLVSAIPMVKAGKLKALAVTGKRRVSALPDVPTMEEAGVPGYEMTWWVAAWAPARTPDAVIAKLNESIANAVKSPKVLQFFGNAGLEAFPTSSDELMKFQIAEHEKWRKIVTAAGIAPQ
jgi:tripartite-type tricarboxylate transporter receptor subunit TctC